MVPQFVSKLFEPNPQLVPDEGRRKLDAKRNQTYFCVFFGSVILYPFLVPFTNFTFETHVANVVINITQTVLFLLLCRSYLWVFHLQYTLFISLAPIGLMLQVDELFFFHQGYAFIIPPFIFLMSNSLVLLSIAGGMQIVIFQTVFKTLFIKNIEEMGPSLFAERFIRGTIVPFVFLVVFLAVILQSLQKKTILLYEANKVAEETLEQQKTFILSFSHELRNPLNSLLGNLQLVLMSHITNECHEMIKTAQICGELLLQYINNLLDTGKFEIGKLEVAPAPIDPYALFQRIWTISYEIIKKKNLSGQLKIARKVPSMLLLDSQKVTQILLNLIGNAVKFTDRGSITVTVEWIDTNKVCDRSFEPIPYDETDEGLYEKQENFSRLSLLNETSGSEQYFMLNNEKKKLNLDEVVRPNIRQEGVLKILVKDTGGGMKKEALKQLFNKFSQVSEDPLKRQIGTGLGLFITRELCKKMNGDIRVYSREKVGSVFTVCIPTYSAPTTRKQADSTASICRTLKEKCRKAIIADDSPFNVSLLCNYFSKLGVIVVGTANNGYDALRKYIDCMERGEPVDIVTLDIDMPKMNGKVACKKIRQYESNFRMPGTNIVMISGNYDETQVKECLDRDGEWKVSYFLKKPLAFEDFSSIVYQLLLRDRSH